MSNGKKQLPGLSTAQKRGRSTETERKPAERGRENITSRAQSVVAKKESKLRHSSCLTAKVFPLFEDYRL